MPQKIRFEACGNQSPEIATREKIIQGRTVFTEAVGITQQAETKRCGRILARVPGVWPYAFFAGPSASFCTKSANSCRGFSTTFSNAPTVAFEPFPAHPALLPRSAPGVTNNPGESYSVNRLTDWPKRGTDVKRITSPFNYKSNQR